MAEIQRLSSIFRGKDAAQVGEQCVSASSWKNGVRRVQAKLTAFYEERMKHFETVNLHMRLGLRVLRLEEKGWAKECLSRMGPFCICGWPPKREWYGNDSACWYYRITLVLSVAKGLLSCLQATGWSGQIVWIRSQSRRFFDQRTSRLRFELLRLVFPLLFPPPSISSPSALTSCPTFLFLSPQKTSCPWLPVFLGLLPRSSKRILLVGWRFGWVLWDRPPPVAIVVLRPCPQLLLESVEGVRYMCVCRWLAGRWFKDGSALPLVRGLN